MKQVVKEFRRKTASQGRIFTGYNVMWHQRQQSRGRAVYNIYIMMIEWFLLLRTPQCFSVGRTIPKIPFLVRILDPIPSNTWFLGPTKRHFDRFHRFAQHTRVTDHLTQTDTQTTLRATSVAVGRIYALRSCDAA